MEIHVTSFQQSSSNSPVERLHSSLTELYRIILNKKKLIISFVELFGEFFNFSTRNVELLAARVTYPTDPQPNHLVLPWTAANDRSVAAHSNQKVQRQQQAGCSSVATSVADTKDLHTYLHIYLHLELRTLYLAE